MWTDIEAVVISEFQGLCGSCRLAPDCAYRKNSDKTIIQCEVFEAFDGAAHPKDETMKGLCFNCARRLSCHLPKGISGVWHCEEYE